MKIHRNNDSIDSLMVTFPKGKMSKLSEMYNFLIRQSGKLSIIDDKPVDSIQKIEVKGSIGNEKVYLTYISEGEAHNKSFCKLEFYNL